MALWGWRVVHDGKTPPPGEVVRPDERLSWPRTVGLGAQHVVAMFGATFVFPIIMGLNPQLAIMMSGIATIIFLLVVNGAVPSYLGTSASFVGGVFAIRSQGGDVLYGMIGLLGAKIWKENNVDFANPINLVPVAAGIIIAIGNTTLVVTDDFQLAGIAFGTIVTIAGYHLARVLAPPHLREQQAGEGAVVVVDRPGAYKEDDTQPQQRTGP